ncbi:MAG: 50S ribosomal protein L11 methyltransferase, partial [Anaerolineaceae bacterium]|nr:50S ribosomal protein L11 methyltransferase [Anaerolineaceae bacterium]
GSGILSIAALELGASHALAVDIDPQAVRATRENAETNSVSAGIETAVGSVSEVLAGEFSLQRAPLVLANILAPVIVRLLAAGLDEVVEPGGQLILSGILDTQAGNVRTAAEARGLHFVEQRQQVDWIGMVMRK